MRLASVLFLALATACGGSVVTPDAGPPAPDATAPTDAGPPPDDADPPVDAAPPIDADPPVDAGTDAPPPGDAGPPPSDEFVALYETVIVERCGGPSCHAPGTNESTYFGYAPRLQMPDATTARAVLVDQRVDCISSSDDRIRVVPFDPAASAIMTAGEDGLCGRRHNIVVPDLTPADLAMIEAWIAGGAL